MRQKVYLTIRNIFSDKSGSTIVTVMVVFIMFVLLSAALLMLSVSSNVEASAQVKTQQNYLTARAAADAVKTSINQDTNFKNMIKNMPVGTSYTGEGVYNSQRYRVTVTKVADTDTQSSVDIKAVALSNTGTEQQPVYVHLNAQKTTTVVTGTTSVTVDCGNVFKNLFYYKGSMTHYMESAGAVGNLSYNGTVYIAQAGGSDSNVKGAIFNNGRIYLSGSQKGVTEIDCISDVFLQDTYVNSGNDSTQDNNFALGTSATPCPVNVEGSLTMTAHSNVRNGSDRTYGIVYGDIHVNGNITMGNNCRIVGNVVCGGNLSIGSNCSITGKVKTRSVSGAGKSTLQSSGNLTITTNVPTLDINYTPPENLPALTVPTITNAVAISSSGVISQNGILSENSYNGYDTLTVDTSQNDVTLIVNSPISLGYQNWWSKYPENLLVSGSHNLLIYLQGSGSITMNYGSMIGMKSGASSVVSSTDSSSWSHIFIIGTNQNITQNDTSLLRANLYIPNGNYKGTWTDGSGVSNYRFIGTAVISDDQIMVGSSSESIYYLSPTLEGTVLQPFEEEIYSTGNYQGNWSGK